MYIRNMVRAEMPDARPCHMETKHNGHVLRNLTNRLEAVIDDERHTQAAVETLERAGIADRELATFEGEESVRQVDAEGS